MASKLRLTVACGDYEIVRALKDGAVAADGLELVLLTDMGPRERHWRLARKAEFDVCEENVGAYFMARDQGHPFTAVPVFMHRRFRHGFVFINTRAGIAAPKDLIGREVGGTNFQPASNIWMRGILEEHYGVPHREITWVVDRSEDVPFSVPPGLRIEMKRSDKPLSDMLADGDLPAMISPTLPRPFVEGDKRIARLFADYKQIEIDYFRQTGIFPIMHVTTVKREIVEQVPVGPDQPRKGVRAGEADRLSARRQPAHDPARLGAHRGRGAGSHSGTRPLGLRPHAGQPEESRDRAALYSPAGPDPDHAEARRPVRGHRSGRRCRVRGVLRPSHDV